MAKTPAVEMTDERRARLFPALDDAQLARVARAGRERTLAAGEVLIPHAMTHVPFYAVLDGALEVVVPSGGAEVRVITVHRRGEFTGEIGMLTNRRSVASIRALEASRVLELDHATLRHLIATDSELGELFVRAFILRRAELIARGAGDVVLVGSSHSAETLELQAFLTRNGHPHVYLDVERDPEVQEFLDRLHVGVDDIPLLVTEGCEVVRRPSVAEVAERFGMGEVDTTRLHDLVVVGAGPAGLAAAVYAASEGLDVVVVETTAPGGQAGTSSRIENYLGFPNGISGRDLAARAATQATKFGAEIGVARVARRLSCGTTVYRIELEDGAELRARAVVIATGARYRRLPVPDLERFEGNGVYYAATEMEASRCSDVDVIVVGGGNSAGQAAVFLAQRARRVRVLVRRAGLAESMSRYLLQRIEDTPNIELCTRMEIVALEGEHHLERVVYARLDRGDHITYDVAHVFSMTGAEPATGWLNGCVTLDTKGFVKTSGSLTRDELAAAGWPLTRDPLQFETSRPRVFAVGDVRAESVKRVAAAVGEGSACVQLLHRVLAE